MKIPEAIQEALVAEDYSRLEDEWLGLASESPEALELFLRIVQALESLGEESRAATLLGVLDEQLREQELWEQRLDLIELSGKRYLRSGSIHDAAIETVTRLYSGREDALEILMPAVGLDKKKDETPKLWDKVHRLRNLLNYREGTVVAMEGKGVGRIVEVNLALQTLKVDLEKIQGMPVGFRAAGKLLEVLAEGHVLHRKLTDLESLQALEPAELLREVLESYDRPMTGAEVKAAVVGVIEEKRWSSWWTTARKHPQVVTTGSGAKATYTWAKSADDASETVWKQFEASDLDGRLELLRRANQQDDDLLHRMAAELSPIGEELLETDPATSLRAWDARDRTRAKVAWPPHEAHAALDAPLPMLAQIDNRVLRERAYDILRQRDDWRDVFRRRFLAETEPKSLDLLAEALAEEGREELDELYDQALVQPQKTPAAATWVAERAAEDAELRGRRGPRILRLILTGLADEAFAPYRPRLEVLCDSGGSVPRILSDLDLDEAQDAKRAIELSRGLEDYRREPLLTALYLRFPSLEAEEEEPMYATVEAFEAKRAELKQLVEEEIPANRKAIEVAREHGDLRENFEYKSARQRHEYLAVRAGQLNEQITRATLLDPKTIRADQVRVGTRLLLKGGERGERSLTILGPWESDPENGIVSHESELARSILGRTVGDEIELQGASYTIARIEPFA